MTTPTEWQAAGRTFDWRGLRVFFRDSAGAGAPLLLLHGFPTSSWDWHRVWDGLAAKHRVIALDYVGFGFSTKPDAGPYNIFAYADQAEALLAHLAIDRAHVLAHDLGDTVAQELLARDRLAKRYLSIAFLNGGLFPELHRPRPTQKILDSPLGFALARLTTKRLFQRGLAEVFATPPSPEELDGFWACAAFEHGPRNFHHIIRYIDERKLHRARWVAPILEPAIPTCMINGHRDPVSGKHVADHLRAHVPRVAIYDLPDVGHYPQSEAPAAVLDAYAAFRSRA